MVEVSTDDLIAFQDHCARRAAENLKERNTLFPFLFVVTTEEGFSEDARHILRGAGFDWKPLGDQAKNNILSLAFPMDHTPRTIYTQLMLVPGRHGLVLPQMLEKGRQLNIVDPYTPVLNAFLKAGGISAKDVQAKFIEHILKLTAAIAFIKIDEAWLRGVEEKGSREKGREAARDLVRAGLRDDKAAGEIIFVSLETISFQRTIMIPFTRTQRNTGQVKDVGEWQTSDTRETGVAFEGRFANLLRPLNPEPRN